MKMIHRDSSYELWLAVITFSCSILAATGSNVKSNIIGPPLPHKAFVVAWNVASERCQEQYDVPLDLSDFDIIYNQDKGLDGDMMVIFYSRQLGRYPSISQNGKIINGGIPQLADLTGHLTKAAEDIAKMIPDPAFEGIAVIDWEAWHPLWDRMSWDHNAVYQNLSEEKVFKEHPKWTRDRIKVKAKSEYESAAREFFAFTLRLAKIVRPRAKWGFYLFPNCFNYNKTGDKSTLRCTNRTRHYNDEIQWLFDDSTALYPSVYLGDWFRGNRNAVYYVANRVLEAVRVDGNRVGNTSIPIFVYHSLTYKKDTHFVQPYDLRNSIGVASLLGASGMIIWGSYQMTDSAEKCRGLSHYISNELGPYVKKTSDLAFQCSVKHCNGNGRCVHSRYSNFTTDERYTNAEHLNANDAYNFVKLYGSHHLYRAFDDQVMRDALFTSGNSVTCQCYEGWSGKSCDLYPS